MKPLNIFCVNNGMKFVSRFASALLLLSFILTPFTTVFAQNTDFFKDHRKITGSEFDISQLENPQLNEIKALLQKVEENKRVFMAEGGNLATPPPSSIDYANPHAPISINGVPLSYDKNGNLLFDGTTTYTYDYNNQLISTTKGGVTTTYLYDHMGQRIATISPTKTTYYPSKYYNVDSTGKVTKHIFAGDSMIATVSSGSSVNEITSSCMPTTTGDWIISTSCTFTGNTVAPASVIVNAGKVLTLAPSSKLLIDLKHYKLLVKHTGGVLIKKGATLRQVKPEDIGSGSNTESTKITYHLTDHLGSTQVSTDATGAVTELSDYYPYGSIRINEGSSKEQRKFIGQEYDNDTGLNYLNARYYDSKRGQFISQDPMFWRLPPELLIDPQQMNSYSYARNNPINLSVPSGNAATTLAALKKTSINMNKINSMLSKLSSIFQPKAVGQKVTPSSNSGVTLINYQGSANKTVISTKTQSVIGTLMTDSKQSTPYTITSTYRTPEQQAQIMTNNASQYGIQSQYNLYGSSGDRVLDLYPDVGGMTRKIYEIGPGNVSSHMKDPNIVNVFDIDPKSVNNADAFRDAVKSNISIDQRNFFYPPNDPAFHLEVPQ